MKLTKSDYEALSVMLRTSGSGACKGVRYEPRVWYDVYDAPVDATGVIIPSPNTDVFINSEEFPVVMTKMIFSVLGITINSLDDPPIPLYVIDGLDSWMNLFAVRIRQHGNYFMEGTTRQIDTQTAGVPIGVFNSGINAQVENISPGVVVWEFDKPTILSTRDSFRIPVQLQSTNDYSTTRPVSVGLQGYGLISKQPYNLGGSIDAGPTSAAADIDETNFRNDGNEPIVLTRMTAFCGPSSEELIDKTPDSRWAAINMKQIGNGSNANWFSGPSGQNGATAFPYCPLPLLGGTGGSSTVIHTLPGPGWVFNPGEGISIDYRNPMSISFGYTVVSLRIGVSLLGYQVVT